MRFSAVFISSAFVLASMSVALPIEREDMLVARFADSDFLAEVEARAYDELYARGGSGLHKDYDTRIIHDDDDEPFMPGFPNPPSQRTTSTKEPPLHPRLRTFNGRSMPDRHHRLHRDYDIRDPFEGLPKPASTNERPLPRLRTFNGRSVPDMHHRDYDTRVLYEPRLPGYSNPPYQRTASRNEPPLHHRPHHFNGNGSPGRR